MSSHADILLERELKNSEPLVEKSQYSQLLDADNKEEQELEQKSKKCNWNFLYLNIVQVMIIHRQAECCVWML